MKAAVDIGKHNCVQETVVIYLVAKAVEVTFKSKRASSY